MFHIPFQPTVEGDRGGKWVGSKEDPPCTPGSDARGIIEAPALSTPTCAHGGPIDWKESESSRDFTPYHLKE